jgi:predicted O-methyltransferase YrrM
MHNLHMNDFSNLNEPQSLAGIWADTRAAGFNMASEPLTCSLLRTLVASKPAARILELGSGTGLSTAWLLDGMDAASQLITVDFDQSLLDILKAVCSDGDEFVRSLQGQRFDLIFADTWAGKYQMLDEVLEMLNPAGLYIIDDMLPQPNWPEGHAKKVENLIAILENRPDFHVTKLSWASGVVIAVKLH